MAADRALPEEETMSFKSRDLMIDVLPIGKFNALAQPGLGMCAQGTANELDEDEGDGDQDELDCAQGTATGNEPPAARPEVSLALLQRQLREALAAAP
jgi:hypothetical protein